jgi:molybdate transport system ATP-binding protein
MNKATRCTGGCLLTLDRRFAFLYQTEAIMSVKHSTKKLITLKKVTLRIRDKFILPGISWDIHTGQNWAVLGPNGVGKSSLLGALAGNIPVVNGQIVRHLPQALPASISFVSFEQEQRIIARDARRDAARYFSGKLGSFEKSADLMRVANDDRDRAAADVEKIIDTLDIRHLLGRGIRFLSTGELRKIMIARALIQSPGLLILDEPFAGLDVYSKNQLKEIINGLVNVNCQLILVVHRFEEITANITHIICLKDDAVFLKGPRAQVLAAEKMDRLYNRKKSAALSFPLKKQPSRDSKSRETPILVEMKNTTVKYGDLLVLDRLNWVARAGENWAVLGPNGAGKSTLLNLIIGENPQAYANNISLFGRRRGSGETIWEIKKNIAFVSSEFQLRYRKKIRAYDVILSGFFDSVGLYRYASAKQHEIARQWIEDLGVAEKSERIFDQLSYGEKRLILIARAMVKSPILLILDEPCQGLDRGNRRMVLDRIEYIGAHTHTGLLYVTHHSNEIPPCITHILRLHRAEESTKALNHTWGPEGEPGSGPPESIRNN